MIHLLEHDDDNNTPTSLAKNQAPFRANLDRQDVQHASLRSLIHKTVYFTAAQGAVAAGEDDGTLTATARLDQVTFCIMVLKNRHRIVGTSYGAVDNSVFDEAEAKLRAFNEAFRKLAELEGYAQRARGLANSPAPTPTQFQDFPITGFGEMPVGLI